MRHGPVPVGARDTGSKSETGDCAVRTYLTLGARLNRYDRGWCRHSVTSGSVLRASFTMPEKILHQAGALFGFPHSLFLFRTPPYEPPRPATSLCAVCAPYVCLRLVYLRHLHVPFLPDTIQPRCADSPHNTVNVSTGTMAASLVCHHSSVNDSFLSQRNCPQHP